MECRGRIDEEMILLNVVPELRRETVRGNFLEKQENSRWKKIF